MKSTGDLLTDLIGAIFRQAVADARKGDTEAVEFLDRHLQADWRAIDKRRSVSQRERTMQIRRGQFARLQAMYQQGCLTRTR